jgi:WD40 repeat protein
MVFKSRPYRLYHVVVHAFLLGTNCSSFPASSSSSSSPPQGLKQNKHVHTFQGFSYQGITSILELDDGIIVAGTKSGGIFQSKNDSSEWTRLLGYNSKFPVYSLATEKRSRNRRIFCGGGDRYVSVWDSEDKKFVQRLGQHTGWVKDLAFDEKNKVLFSIGCNCIEAWDCASSLISHISKRSVENSVSASTLSSDLLKLCLIDGDFLVSSGVDGRIHVWSTDVKVKEPLFEASSHTGRVNSLVYSATMRLLFSVGNDGRLCAFQLSSTSIVLKSELLLTGAPRLTTAFIASENEDPSSASSLVLGTTEGQIIYVSVSFQDDVVTMIETETVDLEEKKKIYALGRLDGPAKDKAVLLVGHAKGMSKLY